MSSPRPLPTLDLDPAEAAALGADGVARIALFRLVLSLAQGLRTLMDDVLALDGLTTQQAALITVVEQLGTPSLTAAADGLATSHQNVRQLADALARKGFLRVEPDADDRRVRRLVTTERCRAYWAQRNPADYERVFAWFEALSAEEAGEVVERLGRVHGTVREALAARR
jgi:DNA-binding MarR family transcriptional regulator